MCQETFRVLLCAQKSFLFSEVWILCDFRLKCRKQFHVIQMLAMMDFLRVEWMVLCGINECSV